MPGPLRQGEDALQQELSKQLHSHLEPDLPSGPSEHLPSNLIGVEFSGGVGVFHMKGWGPKSSVCPSKPGKSNIFAGIYPRILLGYPGGARKVREKNVCVQCLARTEIPIFGSE